MTLHDVPPWLYAMLLAGAALLFLVADHALDGWARVAGMSVGAALCLLLPLAPAAMAPRRVRLSDQDCL